MRHEWLLVGLLKYSVFVTLFERVFIHCARPCDKLVDTQQPQSPRRSLLCSRPRITPFTGGFLHVFRFDLYSGRVRKFCVFVCAECE